MLEPHGGRLVDRVLEGRSASELDDAPSITLTLTQFHEAVSTVTGRLSPLEGFLNKNDFLKVVHDVTPRTVTAACLRAVGYALWTVRR